MSQLPAGTVTFLLTDVEGSTRLWEDDREAMQASISRHHEIVHKTIESFRGARPQDQGEGDSVVGAFHRATDALSCALELQLALHTEPWPQKAPIRVRMAIHTGEIELRDERNYFGPNLNRCARLRALAHGEQVLVSSATQELVRSDLPDSAYLKDLGPHRLKDLSQPEHVFQLCHPEIPEDFPPLKSLEALPNNLPIQLTTLVGREQEVLEGKKLLAESRLITLTGAAGCGKTRLALAIAAESAEEFADGAWFVELDAIAEPGLVPQTVAAALGVQEQPRREMVETLVDYLKQRGLLIVLDNCEHLLAACSTLANTLLRSCPELVIVATSREPLGVAGETSWRVPSLSIPDPDRPPSAEELLFYESAQLFVERARAASPDFVLDAKEAAAIVQICHRLDGIPLAIELAAPLCHVLSCEQIAARLSDMFRLLTGGSTTALERQQTLRAAVEWSHQLLTDAERALLRRLSVFVGGFTLEAAEAICPGEHVDQAEVLDLLSRLVHKSLVTREKRPGAARYRLLETIRQYARERLLESGEGPRVRAVHRDWFLGLAEEAEPELWQGQGQTEWIERLALEQDNLRAAMEWSASEESPELLARLSHSLNRFWYMRGQAAEGGRWLAKVLDKGGALESLWLMRALDGAGWMAWVQHDHEQARVLTEQALAIAREIGDEKGIARSLNVLGNILGSLTDYKAAYDAYEEALAIRERLGDKRGAAALLSNLATIAHSLGDIDQAQGRLERALAINREVGDRHNEALSLFILGSLWMTEDEYSRARPLFEQALSMARELGAKPIVGQALGNLGGIAFIQGDYESARTWWMESADMARDAEQVWGETMTRGSIAYIDGEFSQARIWYMQAVVAARESGEKSTLIFTMQLTAEAAEGEGDYEGASALWEEAVTIAREIPGQASLSAPLVGLGGTRLRKGEPAKAEPLFREALAKSQERKSREGIAQSIEGLAGVAAATDAPERAACLLGSAQHLREEIGVPIILHKRFEHEQLVDQVRGALGEGSFDSAWVAGSGMTPEERIAFASESSAESK